jgi:hypothetical protein
MPQASINGVAKTTSGAHSRFASIALRRLAASRKRR